MNIKDILSIASCENSDVADVINAHPKQFLSTEIRVPIWRIFYSYLTARKNERTAVKYIFHREDYWDSVDNAFIDLIDDFNDKHKDRKISNVKILESEYIGDFVLALED